MIRYTTAFFLSLWATSALAQAVLGGANIPTQPHRPPANSIGNEANWYIDWTSGNIFGPKSSGQWPQLPITTIGPARVIIAPNDGITDATVAIQAALTAAATTGVATYLPAGSYAVFGNLITPSNTNLTCAPGAVIYQLWGETTFINPNAQQNWALNYTTPSRTTATDHDISVTNCTDDHTRATAISGPFALGVGTFAYLLAQRVHLTNNRTFGDYTGVNSQQIPNQIRLQKVFDSNADYNFSYGSSNMVGIWGGAQNVTATFNTGFLSPNTTNANAFSCSNINGVGGAPGDHQTTSQITYSDNACYTQGGDNAHGGVFAYNNGAGSSGSQFNDFTFARNRTYASGTNNGCFDAKGSIDGWRVIDNYFANCDKTGTFPTVYPGLNMGPRAATITVSTNPFTTIINSSTVTVAAPSTTPLTVSAGSYIAINSATVGGLTLGGFYPILSVGTGTLTFNAGSLATSSATGGGTPIVANYWGTSRDSIITGNYFDNDNAVNVGMITVSGPNNVIEDNIVDGGTYGSITLTSNSDCCSSRTAVKIVLSANQGSAGVGVNPSVFGWAIAGDNFNSYQSTFPPNLLDYALSNPWTPNPQINASSVGITGTFTGNSWKSGTNVYLCGSLIFTNKGASVGTFAINGLPYNPAAGQAFPFRLTKLTGTAGITTANVIIETASGGAPAAILYSDLTVTAGVILTDANLTNTTNILFCGTYQSASP